MSQNGTKRETIEKLEGLLARVRMRAVRAPGFEATPADSWAPMSLKDAAAEPPQVVEVAVQPLQVVEAAVQQPEVDERPSEVEHGQQPESWSAPPMTAFADVIAEVTQTDSETLIEAEIEVEPVSEAHDSRERLVAAGPVSVEQVAAQSVAIESIPAPSLAPAQESTPPVDGTDLDVAPPDEQPPISSRRVVASEPEEQLAHMAFDSEEPPAPLHTPPPESGRLPAATVDFDADPDPDVTGVRDATPLLPLRAQPVVREIVPDPMRPQLIPSDMVTDVIAEAQRFSPSTFLELLDASLSL